MVLIGPGRGALPQCVIKLLADEIEPEWQDHGELVSIDRFLAHESSRGIGDFSGSDDRLDKASSVLFECLWSSRRVLEYSYSRHVHKESLITCSSLG